MTTFQPTDPNAMPMRTRRTSRLATHTAFRKLRQAWRQDRALLLVSIGFAAIVLGTIGYHQTSDHYGFFDSLYRALTLFGLGGTVTPPVPVTLQIARILAPIVTGYAAVGTILILSREQARVLGIRLFVREHVIIAGLGATGSRLALALVDREPVVVIEVNPGNERLAAARLRGVRVLIGEAADPLLLRRAGLKHARALVVCCGTDGTNIDVAAAAGQFQQKRRYPLTVFAHLEDQRLWSSLAAEGGTFVEDRSRIRLEYFNIPATGTQLLLEKYPPFTFENGTRPDTSDAHVLIVGFEGIGEQLVVQVARLWSGVACNHGHRLRVILTGPQAEVAAANLLLRYPALERYCEIVARPMAIESAEFQAAGAMLGPDDTCDVTYAYVSLVDEGSALHAALALHSRPDTAHVPVVVPVADDDAGVALVVGSDQGSLREIHSFGILSQATSHELLLRGTNELIARAQHTQWLRNELARVAREEKDLAASTDDGGELDQRRQRLEEDKKNSYLKPWEGLDDGQREANRSFADDLHVKLSRVGATLVPMPLRDPDEPLFTFAPEDVEMLAKHEHKRWMATKKAEGWRHGPERDEASKRHPDLVEWDALSEKSRQWDRNAVSELPETLAMYGFRIQGGGQRAESTTGNAAIPTEVTDSQS